MPLFYALMLIPILSPNPSPLEQEARPPAPHYSYIPNIFE